MTFAFWAYAFAVVFTRARAIVLERELRNDWVHAKFHRAKEQHA